MAGVEDILNNLATDVQLGALIEGQVVPLIIGTVKEVKALAQGTTIEYTVAITTGNDNLTQADQNFVTALQAINAELAKAGKPPVEIPGT